MLTSLQFEVDLDLEEHANDKDHDMPASYGEFKVHPFEVRSLADVTIAQASFLLPVRLY